MQLMFDGVSFSILGMDRFLCRVDILQLVTNREKVNHIPHRLPGESVLTHAISSFLSDSRYRSHLIALIIHRPLLLAV